MSLLDRMADGLATRAGEPTGSLTMLGREGGLFQSLSKAGRVVTNQNVTGIAAVWAAVWLIADQAGSLPLNVFRRDLSAGTLTPAPNAWQQKLLATPNPESSDVDLWTTIVAHLDLWGNAYIGKEKALGRVVRLWPIDPIRVFPRRVNGQKVFDVTYDDGRLATHTTAEVIHVKHRSLDGFIGASPIHIHRNTLGIALALDDFAGDTFKNRAVPLGVLSVKGRINDDGVRTTMRQEWKDRFGFRNRRSNEIAILDDEAKFQPISMPLVDAQYIEQRQHSVNDIARIFGVPPELIGGTAGGNLTYSNVQARRADLLQFVLWSRLKRIQGSLFGDVDLFPNQSLVPRFDDTDFMRGDPKEQYETLRLATGARPVLTQDEARAIVGQKALGGTAAELDNAPAKIPNDNPNQPLPGNPGG